MLFSIGSASAAEIQRYAIPGGSSNLIVIDGAINLGDEVAFKNTVTTASDAIVVLESEGGSVSAALEIGQTIREKGFATSVSPDTLCASACALVWLAGSTRFRSEASHIGFHAAYVVTDGKPVESGVANALVGAYLNQIGLSQEAVIFVTSAPPEGIEWLTNANATQIGISFSTLGEDQNASPRHDKQTYDPLGTVTAFYRALSEADGETAAAFVIPEKRGIGPFNEKRIHDFYGGLSMPLRLTTVSRTAENTVSVTYSYARADGDFCDGQATIETIYKFGKTLISRIHAPHGC
jgi:hypothetical protein